MAKEYDIVIEQGATFTRIFQVNDAAGVARNLTGYTAAMMIKPTVNGVAVVSLTSSPIAGITINAGAGQITVTMTAAETAALSDGFTGVYDLKITSGANAERIVEGSVAVSPQVTV